MKIVQKRYFKAGKKEKGKILDEITENLQIQRKAANRLVLSDLSKPRKVRDPLYLYSKKTLWILEMLWQRTDYPSSVLLVASLAELGILSVNTPSPWNLFMNIPVDSGGGVSFQPPVCQPGDHVLLRAEMDCVIAFSACPQDIVPINGVNCIPTEAHFQVLDG